MPFNADWELQIDTINNTAPNLSFQVNSFGIQVLSPLTADNSINVELYASALGGGPARNGFDTNLDTGGVTVATTDTGTLVVTHGAVRMVFTAATRVVTVFYDLDVSNGYQWIQYGSFGVAGSGGVDGNTDWGLTDSSQFSVLVYGFSQGMTITSGQLYGDNFIETGGVGPVGPPPPAPTGSFKFAFPTNNPLLTAIAYATGNYRGLFLFIVGADRNYDIDVAQDDMGKLAFMGTLDGARDTNNNSELSGTGAITTVNGEPSAQLTESFGGTVDGINTTFTGTQMVPLTMVDIGGGTQGFAGTRTDQGAVAGMPFSATNEPLQAPAPTDGLENLRKDWSIQLDITAKGKKGTKLSVATELVLPNGNTIRFKAKNAKFLAATGLATLQLKKGTNVTTGQKDKLTTVTITGLTFAFQGGAWHPTGGTIAYSFLGQAGTANLLDFILTP